MWFKFKWLLVAALTAFLCFWIGPPVMANQYAQVDFTTGTGQVLGSSSGGELSIQWSSDIDLVVTSVKSTTGKMRLSGDCMGRSLTDYNSPFEFSISPSGVGTSCSLTLEGWEGQSWDWDGREEFLITFTDEAPQPTPPTPEAPQPTPPTPEAEGRNVSARGTRGNSMIHRITQGSGGTTTMIGRSSTRAGHGVRIYCTPSHFANDDPVIFPNQPGASHLHIFFGNSGAQANSTPTSLLDRGNSSCEGGVNVRSSYWAPAVMNSVGEAVIPSCSRSN